MFVEEVKKAAAGKANVKRTFPAGAKKATAVFLDRLPENIQHLIEGMLHVNAILQLL